MIRKYPDLAVATQKDMGADEEWGWLLKQESISNTVSCISLHNTVRG